MANHGKKWLIAAGALVILGIASVAALLVAGSILSKRYEPWLRQQTIAYLQNHFDSDVSLDRMRIQIPSVSPLRMAFTRGCGTLVGVEGFGLTLRRKGSPDLPPLLAVGKFSFGIDMGAILDARKTIDSVRLDGMVITIPPRGERPSSGPVNGSGTKRFDRVLIKEVIASDSRLVILPKIKGKQALNFEIVRLRLQSVGKDVGMGYSAVLTNPKPPGLIHSNGTFGPWSADDPGETPLKGHYTFDHADLSVFPAIAGILTSTGDFEGSLSAITARGTASVPDFRLTSSGNKMPLTTVFEVLVDGSNGNTILKPVKATLGRTQFTTSGAVIRKNGDMPRSIKLDVSMPHGEMRDVLRLALKGDPFMEGQLALKSRISIPPLKDTVKEKLSLNGQFSISQGRFLQSGTQSKIDSLSRRGQGEPKNEAIADVFSNMRGNFRMENETISFRSLSFDTPGASLNLTGNYGMANDALDFHGSLALDARISRTVTGWKRLLLKPVDPFFAKYGAGTFLRIRIAGSSKTPEFGLDHRRPEDEDDVNNKPPTGRVVGKGETSR